MTLDESADSSLGSKPLVFHQRSFLGGMNQLLDPTRIKDNEYFLLINGRNRNDIISPVLLPNRLTYGLPDVIVKFHGLYAAGSFLIAFVDSRAYVANMELANPSFIQIPDFLMSPSAETYYAELVPASSINYKRTLATGGQPNSAINLASEIGGSTAALVVQDGSTQPWLIFNNGTARIAQNYDQWSNADVNLREYVPIGTRMCFSGGKLYIVNGNKLYHSVTGRPLDFVVNVDNNGDKGGNADTVAHAVDFDDVTTIKRMNVDNQSIFVATRKNSYAVAPNTSSLIFGEPTFSNNFLFNTGTLNNFSFTDLLGDLALIDYNSIRSFNAVLNYRNEGSNSPFSSKVSPLFKNITQSVTASITFDNFGLFAVQTIYGPAILIYDTINNTWVGLDIYDNLEGASIKQFAEVKTSTSRRLFFITSDSKLYEYNAGTTYATCKLYLGEWCSNDPKIEQQPAMLRLLFTEIKGSGDVSVNLFCDRKEVGETVDKPLTQAVSDSGTPTIPFGYTNNNADNVRNLSFELSSIEAAQAWKTGFLVTWNFNASLSHVRYEANGIASDQSDESSAEENYATS